MIRLVSMGRPIAFICMIALLFALAACKGENEEYDFSNSMWGMTKEEVQQSEGMPFSEEDSWYGRYLEGLQVFGLGSESTYFFNTRGEFYAVVGMLEYSSGDSYDMYDILKKKMTAAYGKPTMDTEIYGWEKADFDDPAIADMFKRKGQASPFAYWNTQRSEIAITMLGGVLVEFMYRSRDVEGNNG